MQAAGCLLLRFSITFSARDIGCGAAAAAPVLLLSGAEERHLERLLLWEVAGTVTYSGGDADGLCLSLRIADYYWLRLLAGSLSLLSSLSSPEHLLLPLHCTGIPGINYCIASVLPLSICHSLGYRYSLSLGVAVSAHFLSFARIRA